MKNNRTFLRCLIILLTGVIYFGVQAQQKNDTHRANFSGEWKSKESISVGGNLACCYSSGDRMLAKTMKIAEQANFLTIAVSSAFPGTAPGTGQEKLTFDGKEGESQINHSREWVKKFTVKLSADGQTMTVNSIVHKKEMVVYVTEVWKLSNDGKSISVQANAKSDFDSGRSWKTVFDKVR